MDNPSRILQYITETPWAVTPAMCAIIHDIAERHIHGQLLSAAEIEARTGGQKKQHGRIEGDIAVVPVFGVIVPRADLLTEVSGATSAERLGATLRSLAANSEIGAIVLDIDSPGGAVTGIEELANLIHSLRGAKPIHAVANHLAASAAYWIATAADELSVTPSGEVGSIGVYAMHVDQSEANAKFGLKPTFISAGKFKTEGNPHEPLTPEARAAIEGRVVDYYNAFTKSVAKNRGAALAEVRGGFGEGRVVGAKQALAERMVDRIATLDEVIGGLARRQRARPSTSSGRSAAEDFEMRKRRARMLVRP